ncbi:yqaJ domain-containing protein [Trichonephila inaurata madagascariensis]|uniref:YqaJ domain-containing protein n=1 Tax=Trichonephila inaurata madagascariensis TaxID=2747483 RepID=A0A8X6X2F2_9ARAC|nr:yqaJ domain-containing protein [Trichonephila inaurata madagascariensis]
MHPRSVDIRQMERKKVIPDTIFIIQGDFMPKTIFKCFSCEKGYCMETALTTTAMRYGLANEKLSQIIFIKIFSDVKKCGLFVDPENPYLCTSPDGLIGSDGLIEIKCPYSAKNCKNLKEFCISNKKIRFF